MRAYPGVSRSPRFVRSSTGPLQRGKVKRSFGPLPRPPSSFCRPLYSLSRGDAAKHSVSIHQPGSVELM